MAGAAQRPVLGARLALSSSRTAWMVLPLGTEIEGAMTTTDRLAESVNWVDACV